MTTTHNSINDRIITRITITKDSLPKQLLINGLAQVQEPQQRRQQQQPTLGHTSERAAESITLNADDSIRHEFEELDIHRYHEYVGKGPNHIQNDNDECGTVSPSHTEAGGMTLGISIVQGSDNNVYVKDLVRNGAGERHGIIIGDQVSLKC